MIHGMTQGFCGFCHDLGSVEGCGEVAGCIASARLGFRYVFFLQIRIKIKIKNSIKPTGPYAYVETFSAV